MAEGAPAGAPNVSGTDEDSSHSHHQPPPVDGINFGSYNAQDAHDTPEPSEAETSTTGTPDIMQHFPPASQAGESPLFPLTRPGTPDVPMSSQDAIGESTPRAPHARARFPSDAGKLFKTYSAPRSDPKQSVASAYDGEKDREPAAHRGFWQSVRNGISAMGGDLGWPDKQQDIQDIIGDVGIDLEVIKKTRKAGKGRAHKRVSSLVGSSMSLARPALGSRTESSSTVPTNTTNTNGSTPESGTATPGTLRKLFGVGVDPQELARALRRLKKKISQRDSKQTKYLQAKAELAHRRNLVLLIVYAFMAYGAPSHRLEEYALQLFKALEMDGRVNYTVGCMDICFINPVDPSDPLTRTAYTTIVKAQGLDVGACEAAFRLYKEVLGGEVGIEEAIQTATSLIESPPYYKPLGLIPMYGAVSAIACVSFFKGYWTDVPIAFLLGSIVGVLQIIVATKNPLYSNVLEVTAALITSFGARAFASIGSGSQKYFCFGAVAESSIAMILPGYTVLTGTLELQSKSVTAGSTRLFYAVIYSLLLGYGMSVGSQLWAMIYPEAPTSSTCPRAIDARWNLLLVPLYLAVQAVLLRSRPHQIPVQVIIGSAAYAVNYFVSQKATAQVADTASALALGVLGHLWARSQHAFAFAAVVAGIMCLVPGGLAAQGGLVLGISEQLLQNNSSAGTETIYQQTIYQSFSAGALMIQVGVGLAVGIFLSALVVYPFGKKNNALFSF